MDEPKKDCEVCEKLMKEKHRCDFVWKIACIIFLALAVIFAILYFCNGTITTTTTYEFQDTANDNRVEGDGNIIVGGDNITGTATTTDNTYIICISIIAAAAIVAVGGVVIACHYKKDD